MRLEDVKGVGASVARKLRTAGVTSVDELSRLDLRRKTVEGLSAAHLVELRDEARRLFIATRTGRLTLIEGMGPSAERKLKAAGIKTIEDLLALDLRSRDVPGLSTENLRKLRRDATFLSPNHEAQDKA